MPAQRAAAQLAQRLAEHDLGAASLHPRVGQPPQRLGGEQRRECGILPDLSARTFRDRIGSGHGRVRVLGRRLESDPAEGHGGARLERERILLRIKKDRRRCARAEHQAGDHHTHEDAQLGGAAARDDEVAVLPLGPPLLFAPLGEPRSCVLELQPAQQQPAVPPRLQPLPRQHVDLVPLAHVRDFGGVEPDLGRRTRGHRKRIGRRRRGRDRAHASRGDHRTGGARGDRRRRRDRADDVRLGHRTRRTGDDGRRPARGRGVRGCRAPARRLQRDAVLQNPERVDRHHDHVLAGHRDRLVDAPSVDIGAVGRPEVLDDCPLRRRPEPTVSIGYTLAAELKIAISGPSKGDRLLVERQQPGFCPLFDYRNPDHRRRDLEAAPTRFSPRPALDLLIAAASMAKNAQIGVL